MEINEDVKIEHGLRTTTLAKFFFSCTIEKILNILFGKYKIATVKNSKSSKQTYFSNAAASHR